MCVSVCERENERERERWGEMGRNTGEFRSDRAQSERPDLFQVTKPKPICQKLFNYPVFSLLLSGSLALGKVKVKVTRSVMSNSLQSHGLYGPWNSPGQNTGAFPFSRGSSQSRDLTCVSCISCIAGRFFTAEPLGKPLYFVQLALNVY